jgi:hypothetical protein
MKAEGCAGWKQAGVEARSTEVIPLSRSDNFFGDIFDHMETRCTELVKQHWNLTDLSLAQLFVAKYSHQGALRLHTDTGPIRRARIVTVLCYLSTGFKGGELFIPDLGFKGISNQGCALLFPSEELHGAYPVLSGNKTILTGFLCANDMIEADRRRLYSNQLTARSITPSAATE